MRRNQHAAGIGRRHTAPAGDIEQALTRYLLYGLLPAWVLPGTADWVLHRRARIEDRPGARESVVHLAMLAEIGLPAAAVLRYRVDPALLLLLGAGAVAHEATGLWDVRTAEEAGRPVGVAEQHVHSFLESLPLTALSVICCLHPDQVRELGRVLRGRAALPRRLTPRRPALPGRYLAGLGAAAGVLGALYAEEFWRCVTPARRAVPDGAPG